MEEFHSFYCWVIFHCIYIYSYVDGHLGCFHILPVVHNAAVNNGACVSFQISASSLPSSVSLASFFLSLSFFHLFFLFDIYPEAGSCDSSIFVFVFWGHSILFYIVTCQFTFPPIASKGSVFSNSYQHLLCIDFWWWPFWPVCSDTSLWFWFAFL